MAKKATVAEAPKKAKGRPTLCTPELTAILCSRLVERGSLRKVCADDDMPDKATVFQWLLKAGIEGADENYAAFHDQYTRARAISREYLSDEHWEDLAETAMVPVVIDDVPLLGPDGKIVKTITPQSVAFARLKHDAFKWQSSKEAPKKYGDVQEVKHSGEIKTTPPTFVLNFDGKKE